MKFTTRAGALAEALTVARKAMAKTPSLVAYTGVHLVVKAGELTVTGSDGDTTVTAAVAVTAASSGTVLLPPKPVTSYLATLDPGREVTVSTDGAYEVLVTPAGGSAYHFRSLAETYPTPASLKVDKVDVDFSRLAAALGAASVSAGEDRIQLVSGEHGLNVNSTDGYRLTRARLPEAGFGPFSGLLRVAVLEQFARAHVRSVQVDPRGRVVAAHGPAVTIVTRLIDEPFPPVDSILDDVPPYSVQLSTEDLRAKLRPLAAVTETTRPLHVTINGSQMTLHMESATLGSGTETVELTAPSSIELKFGLNLEYLSEAVSSHGAQLTLSWSEPERPIFLTSTDPLPVTSVVMPVRL